MPRHATARFEPEACGTNGQSASQLAIRPHAACDDLQSFINPKTVRECLFTPRCSRKPINTAWRARQKKFLLSTCLDYRESASEGKSFISRRSLITGWTDGRNLQRLVFEICAELRQAPRRLGGGQGFGDTVPSVVFGSGFVKRHRLGCLRSDLYLDCRQCYVHLSEPLDRQLVPEGQPRSDPHLQRHRLQQGDVQGERQGQIPHREHAISTTPDYETVPELQFPPTIHGLTSLLLPFPIPSVFEVWGYLNLTGKLHAPLSRRATFAVHHCNRTLHVMGGVRRLGRRISFLGAGMCVTVNEMGAMRIEMGIVFNVP
ncbi:hypothetical protein CEXT_403821 [Caerostris extrusa]|uniref:Uncharacterized protein n=1 Tax=Caerostris extrusa TaxID=172846 RepID=A0AAV4RLH9_CAEEX|nr:hypothetical protein CEXT_403821 [Caerostris extrusa]